MRGRRWSLQRRVLLIAVFSAAGCAAPEKSSHKPSTAVPIHRRAVETALPPPDITDASLDAAPMASQTSDEHGRIRELVRACAERGPTRGLGVHGSALVFEKASVETPSEARARGDRSDFTKEDPDQRLVWVPEAPPFDQIVPNGIVLRLNVRTGTCKVQRSMR